MADSDFLSYSSVYETFSKGPKSIYYGIGDEMLPGAILNVPQTDDDDEWGRTQRISDERSYDFIAKIYKTLFDPYNSIADVSLVPGEAGSEINVAKNIIKLVGRAGIDTGVFDLSVPSLTLGDIVVNGSSESILIGSGFEATETSLKLNTYFEIESTSEKGSISYKDVSTDWYDYSGVKKFTITVNGKVYLYSTESGSGDPMFELPVGGVLHVQGTSKTNNILPNANESYDLGSSSLRFNVVYAKTQYSTDLRSNALYASYIYPTTSPGVLEIGNLNNVDTITVRASVFRVFGILNENAVPTIEMYKSGSYNLLNLGDASGNYVVNVRVADSGTGTGYDAGFNIYNQSSSSIPALAVGNGFIWMNRTLIPRTPGGANLGASGVNFGAVYTNSLYSGTGAFSDTLTTRNILPETGDTYDIGSDTMRFEEIYARHIFSSFGLYSNATTQWYLCGPDLRIYNNEVGTIVAFFDNDKIDFRVPLTTYDISPKTDDDYNIGSSSLTYKHVYAQYMHSNYGLYSDASYEWSICGPNMKIRVNGNTKIGVCASYIEMYEHLYTESIYPISSSGKYIGSIGGGYEAIYLRDQTTLVPVRVYVSNGVLHP